MIAGFKSGRMTVLIAIQEFARRVSAASSKLLSIWVIEAIPARIPTGMLRNMKHKTMIVAEPVNSNGAVLKAKMYATPITVPGTAKLNIVPSSNRFFPLKLCRDSKYAVRMPKPQVSGAAMLASWSVVQNELHAPPDQTMPPTPDSIEKARK